LENFDYDNDVDISRAQGSIKGNIKASTTESLGYYELKQYKPWFDNECSELLDQRKHNKFQWLQKPTQRN